MQNTHYHLLGRAAGEADDRAVVVEIGRQAHPCRRDYDQNDGEVDSCSRMRQDHHDQDGGQHEHLHVHRHIPAVAKAL